MIDRENQFLSRAQVYGIEVSEPVTAGKYFTISLSMDFTTAGEEKAVTELCVYKIKDGLVFSQ